MIKKIPWSNIFFKGLFIAVILFIICCVWYINAFYIFTIDDLFENESFDYFSLIKYPIHGRVIGSFFVRIFINFLPNLFELHPYDFYHYFYPILSIISW